MSIHYSAINHQYVSIICEEQGYLVYDELPMKINQSLLNRIHDYVNNENYTLLDLQNLVIQNGFIREYTSEYAHLFAYQDSYIDINKHVKINILTEDEYYRSIPKYKSEKYLKQLNQTQKESFAKDDGYSFEVYEEAVGDHPFVRELYNHSEVISIVRVFSAMF